MFKNNVTQTYNNQDATLEILVMLGGAILLGFLLGWLIKSLLRKNKKSNSRQVHSNKFNKVHSDTSVENTHTTPPVGNSSRKARAVKQTNASYTVPRTDDLTKISGINSDVENILKKQGIMSFTDLRDAKKETLILSSGNQVNSKEIETWHHQSSLASKGEWKKLTEYQEFTTRSRTNTKNEKPQTEQKYDDLKKIEGIGPRIEEILNSHRIYSFEELRKTDRDTLKTYLTKADNRFNANETESWPHQAGMAEKGQWEELKIYQEFIDESNDEQHSNISLTTKRAIDDKQTIKQPFSENDNISNITENDDLKKIEGIGPKIEELLNKSAIYTFSTLKDIDRDTLKSILEEAGPQYRMHEPKSWPEQALLAFNGDWKKLTEYQDFLLGGRE